MLMQKFGVTNKERYGMLWYFLERSIGVDPTASALALKFFFSGLHSSVGRTLQRPNLEAMGSNPVDSAPAPNFFSVKFALA